MDHFSIRIRRTFQLVSTRDDFQQSLLTLTRNTDISSLQSMNNSFPMLPESQSLYGQQSYKDYMIDYVPNKPFAKMLNKDCEIIVNDTIYQVIKGNGKTQALKRPHFPKTTRRSYAVIRKGEPYIGFNLKKGKSINSPSENKKLKVILLLT